MAIILITVVIIIMPYYYELIYDEPPQSTNQQETVADSGVINETQKNKIAATPAPAESITKPQAEKPETALLEVDQDSSEKIIQISTPLVDLKISNKGAGKILEWTLKNYAAWNTEFVQIINDQLENGPQISFQEINGEIFSLDDYLFFSDKSSPGYAIGETEQLKLTYHIQYKNSVIEKSITIYGNSYHIDVDFNVTKPEQILLNNEYLVAWLNGIPSNESNIKEDYTYAEAYASMGGELESYSVDSEEPGKPVLLTGKTDWVASRMKYFMVAVVPEKARADGANLSGYGAQNDDILYKNYSIGLNILSGGDMIRDSFKIYMGPLDYSILKSYELELETLVLNHGWYETTFRPISLLVLSIFKFFQKFIPNYGIVIIIFSILIKLLVYPLTKKSYESMSNMGKVQPMVAELKEKYKNDPQRMNREMMKLYKQEGINPMGGCLPGLLQLPILAALFIVFRSTIQLRGASFIPGWIDDLSRPDTIATLPFSIPFYGADLNVLPILMAVSMIIQQKMTMKDPKQKALVYLMPIFLLFLFNQFPSGLNLYYTLFNVLTIFQQKLIERNKSKEPSGKPAN